MVQASVRVDPVDKAVISLLLANIKNGYPKAMSRAINAGLSTARIEARRKVQEEVTAKTTYVNAAFEEQKATYSKLSGSLVSTGQPLPLIAYKTSQINAGVNVQVNTSGSKSLIKKAFISTVKAGNTGEHKGVFIRQSRIKGKGKWPVGKKMVLRVRDDKYRLPIKQLFGPSIPAIFERGPIMEHVESKGGEKCQEELLRQTDLLLA
jgi:hypothetical protein